MIFNHRLIILIVVVVITFLSVLGVHVKWFLAGVKAKGVIVISEVQGRRFWEVGQEGIA